MTKIGFFSPMITIYQNDSIDVAVVKKSEWLNE